MHPPSEGELMTDLAKIVELAQQIVELASEEPPPPPVPAPSGDAAILAEHGLVNTEPLVAATIATGVPLWVAAAFVEKESMGRNVYGGDTGGVFATTPRTPVTEENFAEFYRLVVDEKKTSNGVGPMQITYPGYFPKAKEEGLQLWVPLDNFVFGLKIVSALLKGDYTKTSLEEAGTLYNKGNLNDGVTSYGRDLAAKAAIWAERLGVAIPPDRPVPERPVPIPPPPTTEPVVGDTLREGDTGLAVSVAQERLTAHGWPEPKDGVPNGIFGSRMTLQVKGFQSDKGLDSDGVIGEKTWAALKVKSASEMRAETLRILKRVAWAGAPDDTQIIKDFQAAWAFSNRALVVDGIVGPVTYNAATQFRLNGEKLSEHFTAREMQCRCGDRYDDCRRVFVKRSLLLGLEKLRSAYYPSGLRVVSGARCEQYNASLKNAYSRSQHRYGRGCDIEPKLTKEQVAGLGVFSGIGYDSDTNKVIHVDVRADDGPDRDNYPLGTVGTPRMFPE